jgi:hypothetical protein
MDDATAPADPRKAYTKPLVVRVDLVEDEVALASCKKATFGSVNSSMIHSASARCRTSCSALSPT